MTTNEQLLQIRDFHKLRNTELAKLLNVTMYAVRNWISKPGSINYRVTPMNVIELLRYKLNEVK